MAKYPIRMKMPDEKPAPKSPPPAAKRTPREEREKAAMEKKYPFNKYAEGGMIMKKAKGGKCYAKGGSVSSRADGIAKKGKTNCKMPAMARGGKMKGCK
jgi:hypothetical protein